MKATWNVHWHDTNTHFEKKISIFMMTTLVCETNSSFLLRMKSTNNRVRQYIEHLYTEDPINTLRLIRCV